MRDGGVLPENILSTYSEIPYSVLRNLLKIRVVRGYASGVADDDDTYDIIKGKGSVVFYSQSRQRMYGLYSWRKILSPRSRLIASATFGPAFITGGT